MDTINSTEQLNENIRRLCVWWMQEYYMQDANVLVHRGSRRSWSSDYPQALAWKSRDKWHIFPLMFPLGTSNKKMRKAVQAYMKLVEK